MPSALSPQEQVARIRERLALVLDPELDEPILDLGFVRSIVCRDGECEVALRLPTSWCAVNFAYLMAEDVRRAAMTAPGVRQARVRLGDHCAAAEIEAAVNAGLPFAAAFPDAGIDSLENLRLTFLRKGFYARQERLIRALRAAGLTIEAICALRFGAVRTAGDDLLVDSMAQAKGGGALLRRYLERRAELGLDCSATAPLIADLDGKPYSGEQLEAHYEAARTMRLAMEANGSFCRALANLAAAEVSGGSHVQA
jgi:metal-sulfur cluster biosynthetic enzyme